MSAIKIILSTEDAAKYAQAKEVIREGLRSFVETGAALLAVREERWYRADGHTTFEGFCQKEYQIGDRHARRLMGAAEVIENLKTGPIGPVSLPATESQARPLATIPADQQSPAWGRANEAAAAEGVPVAARHVEAAVAEVREPTHRDASDGLTFDGKTPAPVPMGSIPSSGSSASESDDFYAVSWVQDYAWRGTFHYRDRHGNDRLGNVVTQFYPNEAKPWRVIVENDTVGDKNTVDGAKELAETAIRKIQSYGNNDGKAGA